MLLLCSTGKAHMLLLEWRMNEISVSYAYHNLITYFDTRLTPGEARVKLFAFWFGKSQSLLEGILQVMEWANRAASVLPPGVSRDNMYNLEATECLMQALPGNSRAMVQNL
jgi:hypothetical protein